MIAQQPTMTMVVAKLRHCSACEVQWLDTARSPTAVCWSCGQPGAQGGLRSMFLACTPPLAQELCDGQELLRDGQQIRVSLAQGEGRS